VVEGMMEGEINVRRSSWTTRRRPSRAIVCLIRTCWRLGILWTKRGGMVTRLLLEMTRIYFPKTDRVTNKHTELVREVPWLIITEFRRKKMRLVVVVVAVEFLLFFVLLFL
jgi:hypothetical protein